MYKRTERKFAINQFALVRWVEPSRLSVPLTSAQAAHATLKNERFAYKRRCPAEEQTDN